MSTNPTTSNGPQIFLTVLGLASLLGLIGGLNGLPVEQPAGQLPATSRSVQHQPDTRPAHFEKAKPDKTKSRPRQTPGLWGTTSRALPHGGTQVFDGRFLVAYYGTAATGALGVLGEAGPERIIPRLARAAEPFARPGHRVQSVFELIVTVAHATPARTGTYSTDIDRALVERYIRVAQEHDVLVVLDLQPGTADFLSVARRWKWALLHPWVGLALDPEWRMSQGGVPGRRIGSVGAAEINRVSRWLDQVTVRNGLPQKVFMLHQFRTDMIRNLSLVKQRTHLAMVQHVDGFGTPGQKLATYRHVARPDQFQMGFKLFYDEDTNRMTPAEVLRIRPRVGFVSFQ